MLVVTGVGIKFEVVVPGMFVAFWARAPETLRRPTRRDSMMDTVHAVGNNGKRTMMRFGCTYILFRYGRGDG